MNNNILIEINKYRKHPRFQVERHFDIFLIPFLPSIINRFYETEFEIAVPEFPIRKKLVNEKYKSDMESISADYALFDRKNKRIAFVELKTDNESNNTIQDNNMKKLVSNVKAVEVKKFIEDRCIYKPNTLTTYKYQELRTFLQNQNVYDCFSGNCYAYKITPHNIKMPEDQYLSFRKVVNEYDNNSTDWQEIKKYLEIWDEGIK